MEVIQTCTLVDPFATETESMFTVNPSEPTNMPTGPRCPLKSPPTIDSGPKSTYPVPINFTPAFTVAKGMALWRGADYPSSCQIDEIAVNRYRWQRLGEDCEKRGYPKLLMDGEFRKREYYTMTFSITSRNVPWAPSVVSFPLSQDDAGLP